MSVCGVLCLFLANSRVETQMAASHWQTVLILESFKNFLQVDDHASKISTAYISEMILNDKFILHSVFHISKRHWQG